ncbi:porin family protein [Chitinophaga japonensis]|uniref:Outer membrane protein with beta-barrel domain n=1 Tax=Chitinophaga japonensis TaxID=104662 RepID=A0A562T6B2_CHIJA|nr:porin family protein [Chitinophaga japonensis]TWI89077.1 outer membrane protein with beta-barrel domain [Chitinophaga japonensis]
MTNKLLATVAGLLLLATAGHGQSFHYGLKADLLFTNINGKGMSGSFRPGVNAGIFTEYSLGKKWGLQPELLFTLFNNKSEDFLKYYVNSGNSSSNGNINLGYLSIPLLLQYKINDVFSVHAGPQYSLLLYSSESLLQNNRDAFAGSDLGVAAGLTLQVSQVRFYGRYVMGLSNVNDVDDRYKWNTNQIQLGIGIAIR